MNSLEKLATFGQSPWLDDLRRSLVTGGGLQNLIDNGLRGLTSNPAIFEAAIAKSNDYDDAIRQLAQSGKSIEEIYRTLTVEDVQGACDLFRPLYDETGGADGFVSYEVSPKLANDTDGTIQEARELWRVIDRPNVMIKVPATKEGLPAIRQLISEGINVNVTLIFGLPRYKLVAQAYVDGLQDRLAEGGSVEGVASVASFFLSRIDSLLDPKLEDLQKEGGERGEQAGNLLPVRLRWPARRWRMLPMGKFLGATILLNLPRKEPNRNACCGRAPAPKTRLTPKTSTCSLSLVTRRSTR